MKPTTTHLATSALLLAAATTASAQSYVASTAPPPSPGLLNEMLRQKDMNFAAWDVGAQVRLRYEDRNNFIGAATGATAGANDFKATTTNPNNTVWLQRVKPRVGYTAEWFSMFAEGRSSHTTGDDRNPNPESDSLDLHQGYVTLGNLKEFPLSLKVGRQELSYGDERLVGAFDWNNLGRVFDGGKLRWQNEWFGVDAFATRLVLADDNNFNVANDYEYFSGLYFNSKTLVPKTDAQWYVLARNVSTGSPTATTGAPQTGGPAPRDIYTVGARFKSLPGEFGPWDYTAELMGQFGHFNDTLAPGAKSLEHEAYAVFAAAGYTWSSVKFTPRVGLEYNFASGDSDPADGKHETFENLYPTNHKFYGFMDLVALQNIHNLRLTTSIKPLPRLTLTGDLHAFWLADTSDNFYTVAGFRRGGVGTTPGTGYGVNPTYSSYVGAEVDLTATWTVTRYATAQVGYGHFFVGDYIKQSLAASPGGSADANWLYAQLNFNF